MFAARRILSALLNCSGISSCVLYGAMPLANRQQQIDAFVETEKFVVVHFDRSHISGMPDYYLSFVIIQRLSDIIRNRDFYRSNIYGYSYGFRLIIDLYMAHMCYHQIENINSTYGVMRNDRKQSHDRYSRRAE